VTDSAQGVLRTGVMMKKSIDTNGVSWEPRFLSLTDERLLISKIGNPKRRIFDFVNMKDIVECEFKQDNQDDLSADTSTKGSWSVPGHTPDMPIKMLEVIIRTTEEGRSCGRR